MSGCVCARCAGGWRLGYPALLPPAARSARPHAAACARLRRRPPANVPAAGGSGAAGRAGTGQDRAGERRGPVSTFFALLVFFCLFVPSAGRPPPPVLPARCPQLPAAFVSAEPPRLSLRLPEQPETRRVALGGAKGA